MKRPLASVAGAIFMAACASDGPRLELGSGQYTQVQVIGESGLPTPTDSDTIPDLRPYRIGPFDKLRIDVFGMEELSREVQADATGQFSFPLVGVIDAAGKTPREVEAEITQRLRAGYVREPEVTVNLTETVSQVVTVDGQVGQPGLYPVVGRMTLVRAIATARGTTEFARTGNVLVFRRVDGQDLVGLYNLHAIRQGLYPDPEIFPNDVVVVDESRARRMFRDFLQLAPTLTAPLIAVLQSRN